MSTECFPISLLHPTLLYEKFVDLETAPPDAPLRGWYGAAPTGSAWLEAQPPSPVNSSALADALTVQAHTFESSPATFANIELLRGGARAVVTGQQVGLFGGPLLTLLKAATAIARAAEATCATGIAHVPIFWLASEDHDVAEVDQATLAQKVTTETLHAGLHPGTAQPAGEIVLATEVLPALDRISEFLDFAPEAELLRELYAPGQTLGRAFARLMARLFAAHGLIVLDASTPDFHRLGAQTLRYAIEHAAELEDALLARTRDLESAGFHAQVKVASGMSLLFLISDVDEPSVEDGAAKGDGTSEHSSLAVGSRDRQALRRTPDGMWKAGRHTYATADLLRILDRSPERLSPNALLRPVFQDTLLPTTAYIGGPAETAYFAQSAVLFQAILGRITPVLPRLSATLLEPAIATVLDRHELALPDALTTPEQLALRLGARAMPVEGKRKLAAAGNQLDRELTALTSYLSSVDESLGRSAAVSASKMRYQMNRLRTMGARFELEKEASLRRHAEAITTHLFPNGHPQERVIGGVQFVARYGESLIDRLVAEAANRCPGHIVIRL